MLEAPGIKVFATSLSSSVMVNAMRTCQTFSCYNHNPLQAFRMRRFYTTLEEQDNRIKIIHIWNVQTPASLERTPLTSMLAVVLWLTCPHPRPRWTSLAVVFRGEASSCQLWGPPSAADACWITSLPLWTGQRRPHWQTSDGSDYLLPSYPHQPHSCLKNKW